MLCLELFWFWQGKSHALGKPSILEPPGQLITQSLQQNMRKMVFIQLTMKKFAQVHGSKWQKKILWFSEPCFLHEEYICPSLHHWGIRYSLTCNECITFFLPLVIQNYHLTVFLYIKSLKKVTSGELHLLTFHLLSTCLSLPSSSITFLRKCCRQRSSNHLQIILSTGLFIISILLPWNVRGSLSMFIK